MRIRSKLGLTLILGALSVVASAQDSPPAFPAEQLDSLTAPIALYPDSLLSQVLMACTYPADVALAADWVTAHPDQTGDAAVKAVEAEPWDPSVKSLVAFPQVLAMMKEQPEWVQNMGDAFLAQSKDVMDSIQRLRKQAKDSGNLKDSEQIKVTEQPAAAASTDATSTTTQTTTNTSTTTIIIEPADPQVVYVPNYQPTVVYGTWAYPTYPPYYFPPPPGYTFGSAVVAGIGFATGVAIVDSLWGDCDWGHGDVDIDVDRYNNINVGNKINTGDVNWQHNSANRGGVPYRDSATRNQYAKTTPGAEQRADYRGRDTASASTRDAQRAAASQQFERTTGVSPSDRSRVSTDQINRDLAGQGRTSGDLGSRSDAGRPSASTRDTSSRGSGAGVSTRDTSSRGGGGGSYSGGDNRSSAVSGASSPSRDRQSVSRGSSSAGGRSVSASSASRSSAGGGARGGGGGGGGRRR